MPMNCPNFTAKEEAFNREKRALATRPRPKVAEAKPKKRRR